MINKEQVELGSKYHDLVENNPAFQHLMKQIHERIELSRSHLEAFNTVGGAPQAALSLISTIQALNWVLDTIDDEIQRGLDEVRKAAILQDPQDPNNGQSEENERWTA